MLSILILIKFLTESIFLIYMGSSLTGGDMLFLKACVLGFMHGLSSFMTYKIFVLMDLPKGMFIIITLSLLFVIIKYIGNIDMLQSLIAVFFVTALTVIRQTIFIILYVVIYDSSMEYDFFRTNEFLIMDYISLIPIIIITSIIINVKKIKIFNSELIKSRSEEI